METPQRSQEQFGPYCGNAGNDDGVDMLSQGDQSLDVTQDYPGDKVIVHEEPTMLDVYRAANGGA